MSGAPSRRQPPRRRSSGGRAPAARSVGTTESDALVLVHRRLRDAYGSPEPDSRLAPLDEVVFTILSQNTTDTNRDRAWASLWGAFDSWEEIASARVDSIAAAIAVGGLHRVKARRIKDLLRRVCRERGDYDLDYLESLDLEEAREELGRYKGIGAKSANCVLLFSLGLPAFPVDTHVHRILRRLGILATKDLSRANREMQQHVPDAIAYPLHMNVIRHGREVCHARRPACWSCCIEDLCAYESKNLDP